MAIDIQENTSTKQFEANVQEEMQKHIKHFEHELVKIRTGRAHPSVVEDTKISCYGAIMPLKDVASITAPDSNMIVIQPWDKSVIAEIEKSLSVNNLGMTISNDGNIIRLILPPMSAARREELIKAVSQKLEATKVALRNVRKDVQNLIRATEKNKSISEDYSKRIQDLLQKMTDKSIELSEKISEKKEHEIKS